MEIIGWAKKNILEIEKNNGTNLLAMCLAIDTISRVFD